MSNLKTLQAEFINALDNPQNSSVQLKIYHDSMIGNLTQVLNSTYPVCAALVGADYFDWLAKNYIVQTPYYDPDLTFYGATFASFLAENVDQHRLLYLAEVAKFECACLKALEGRMQVPMDIEKLAQVPEEQQGHLCFHLPLDSTLFYSQYPIYAIWQMHQPGYEGAAVINIDMPGSPVLIWRREYDLCITELNEQEFAMLTLFDEGQTFAAVCEVMEQKFDNVEIVGLFTNMIERGWLGSFY